ncbi:MAG: hypothetical protein ACQESR_09505, partial [Planctomycetota bacterium]
PFVSIPAKRTAQQYGWQRLGVFPHPRAGLYLAGDANARIARTTVTNNRGEAVTGGHDAVHGGGIYAAGGRRLCMPGGGVTRAWT